LSDQRTLDQFLDSIRPEDMARAAGSIGLSLVVPQERYASVHLGLDAKHFTLAQKALDQAYGEIVAMTLKLFHGSGYLKEEVLKDRPKLKDIDSIDISTKKDGERILVVLDITLKDNNKRTIGGLSTINGKEGHPKRPFLSFKLLSNKNWKVFKPDELSLNLGVVRATWRKKFRTLGSH
jgi:hypothetical protein